MKKAFISGIFAFLVLFLIISPAQARYLDPEMGPFMTDEGSTAERSSFDVSETPFAYIGFDAATLNPTGPLDLTWSWYFDNDTFIASESMRITDLSNPLGQDIWNSLDSWSTLGQLGNWRTVINWENRALGGRGGFGSQSINFTVTPEPASALLFLLGGTALAFRQYRKKRNLA